jgi:hypothetical protein
MLTAYHVGKPASHLEVPVGLLSCQLVSERVFYG